MTLPGTTVTSGEDSAAASLPTDISTVFIAGFSERGPIDKPSFTTSLGGYRNVGGARVSYGLLYDWLDVHFREGGSRAYWARVVGPTPKYSSAKLSDGSKDTLEATAVSPGGWGNELKTVVTVPGAGTFKIEVELAGVVKQTSPTLSTNTEAVTWASTSTYIRLKDLGGGDPKAATSKLEGGDDDRANATEKEWAAALALFTADLGPGKVLMPGRTTEASAENILAHCEANGRTARLDGADTEGIAGSVAQVAALRGEGADRYGGLFWPWAVVPGIAASTDRTVPYTAVDTGIAARNAAAGLTPNDVAAGVNGIARYATGLSQPALTEDEREEATDGGVNIAREMLGGIRTYGYRTLVNSLEDETWLDLGNADLDAYIKAKCKAIGERFVFRTIDGRGRLAAQFAAAITGEVLAPLYEAEALFGETAAEAYEVRVGPDVNTAETINEGKLRAIVSVQMSEFAERVEIEIVKELN